MKKKIFGLLLVVSLLFVTACSGDNSKLKDIANKFNESDDVKQMKEYGTTYEAKVDGKTLTVSISGESIEKKSFDYKLEDDVLSGDFKEDEGDAALTSMMIIDAICQINGYKKGEIYATINDERIFDYKLDKEGFEINSEDGLHFKINITKKIPLLDFSNVYVSVEDLEDAKDSFTSGSYYIKRGNVILTVSSNEDTIELLIAEDEKLTELSYKTLESALEVAFNDAAVSYLNDNYSLSDGSKEFAGIKIESNVTLGEDEFTLPSDTYKVMRVTIDRDAFIKAIR